MNKSHYYVSFCYCVNNRATFFDDIEIEIEDNGVSQGMLAEKLQSEISEITKAEHIVIINFWKL